MKTECSGESSNLNTNVRLISTLIITHHMTKGRKMRMGNLMIELRFSL
ncbi:hypothetical protein [Roseivirga pacifica]